jgi:predicted transposase YdaD
MASHYKDSLFRSLFSDKKALLELYNSIKGTHYDEKNELEINTLSETLFTQGKNDVSFVIDGKFVVVGEHQSTINKNMPFRCLYTVTHLFVNGITDRDAIYQKKLVKFPRPEFLVLYNGTEKYDDKMELRLSDAFHDVEGFTDNNLELIVKVINVNKGHNQPIIEKSELLTGYVEFVDLVRKYQEVIKKENPEMKHDDVSKEAVIRAIEYCKKHNILTDFWETLTYAEENMLAFEYDRERELEVTRREAREDGIEEGLEGGRVMEREQIAQNALRKGFSPEIIHEITGLDTQTISSFSMK